MNSKTFGILLVFLSIFFNFYFRYPFLNVPLERDEGEYAYISNVIADGGVPYRDAFDQKPPGIFYLYYLIFLFFGKKVIALRLFTAFYNLISIYFVYRIGKLIKDKNLGLLAALIFAMTSSERRLLGFSANTETFMLAPLVAGTYFVLSYLGSRKPVDIVIAGVLFGVSVLFKQPAFLNFAGIFAVLVYYGIKNREKIIWHVQTYCIIAISFVAPLALCALYFIKVGAFGEFKYQVLLHNFAYVGREIPIKYALKNLFDTIKFISQSQAVLWAMLFLGFITIIVKRNIKYFELMIFWLLFSLIGISLGKRFTLHYFQQLMPPLALIAACGFYSLAGFLKKNKVPKPGFAFMMILIVIVLLPFYANKAYSDHDAVELTSAVYSGSPFNEDVKAAEFIKERTGPTDKVFVVGSEPQIYFYAGRKCASKYIFFYPLTGGYSDSLSKQQEVVKDLILGPPKYIVYANYALSLGVMPSSPNYIFEEMDKILQIYDLAAVINPREPDHVYYGKELDQLFRTEKDIYNAERLFIYEKK